MRRFVCTKCGIEKDETHFAIDTTRSTGVRSCCRECRRKYDASRHAMKKALAAKQKENEKASEKRAVEKAMREYSIGSVEKSPQNRISRKKTVSDGLLPCPFCGKTPTAKLVTVGSFKTWDIECACTKDASIVVDFAFDSEEALRTFWNRRAHAS